jgi:glycosyltransferase involved in cell wall biosynthesis
VIGIGAFVPEKNIEFVIRAVAATSGPHPELIWVGNTQPPEYMAQLVQLAEKLGVRFTPKLLIPDAEVVDLLQKALAMVYAPRLEPFGYAPLEANSCGTPVVAVAEGGVRETVVDGINGLIVDAKPTAMAAAIDRLRDDPDLAARLGREGRKVVEDKWSLAASVTRLESHLAEVAGKGGSL